MVNVMDWAEWTRNFKFRRWQFNSYTFIMCLWLQYLWRCQCPCVCTCPNIPTPRAGSEHVHHKSNPRWTSGVSVGFRNAVALGPKQNLANLAKLWYYGPTWVKTAAPDIWRRAAEPLCTRASLQSVLKALELLAPGNDNSGLKLQHLLKLQERPGSAAQSRSGECEGLWRSIWRSVYVCWPGVKNKRFHSGNVHLEAGCWKLLPELCYWWDTKVSCVVPALVTQCHTWGPTMLMLCSHGILVARRRDLLIGSAGPLSLASSESRLQEREERGEPPQRWALGLFALCYHLGFDVLFWRRIKRMWVFQSIKNIEKSLLVVQQSFK